MARPLSFCAAAFSPLCLAFLVAAGLHPCLAESSEDGSRKVLDALVADYHREIEEEVEKVYKAEVADLLEKYLAALRGSLQSAQEEGNLEVALGFRNEIERIESGQSEIESETPGSSPVPVTRLREVYDRNLAMLEEKRNQRRAPIYRKTSERMTQLQEQLTKAGQLEEALRVKQERESLLAAEPPKPDEASGMATKPDAPELGEASGMASKSDAPEPGDELVAWLQGHELFWRGNTAEVVMRFEGQMVRVFADGRQIMEKEIVVLGKNRFSFPWSAGDENTFELARNRKSFTRSRATGEPQPGEVRKVSE